jgi:hypothetical protein
MKTMTKAALQTRVQQLEIALKALDKAHVAATGPDRVHYNEAMKLVDAALGRPEPRKFSPVLRSELAIFAEEVKTIANSLYSENRFGRYKVFIAPIWTKAFSSTMTREEFDAAIISAHRNGFLHLCRADLVPAMDPRKVLESEVTYLGLATFHFVDLEA